MAPLLVYRSLREASDWMLNYYSEIGVLGQENIPREGPLLMLVYSQTWTEGTALNPETMLTLLCCSVWHAITTRLWILALYVRAVA